MTSTWRSDAPPPPAEAFGIGGWLRVVWRGVPLAALLLGGLAVLLAVRLPERLVHGAGRRPWTPWITQGVCRAALAIIGLRRRITGLAVQGGAVVANHSSWLDIFVLNAGQRVCFVSKSDVRRWPGIGWLARATGTVFIDRQTREAGRHRDLLRTRLADGHPLLLFPEGTSTDGRRVLPFRSSLFAAFLGGEHGAGARSLQPVTVIYHAPAGEDPRFYGWWAEMDFAPHLLTVLAAPRQGRVEVHYHAPLSLEGQRDRKALARACEDVIRSEFERQLAG